jgi:hypothetical protein
MDRWKTLIWRNHKWRGEQPGTPGINLREHCAYFKSCVGGATGGGTWIIGNDLRGGNRTGFQVRPQADLNMRPTGPVVIANNYADGYGWNNGSDGSSYDGGGCITVWTSPEWPVYIFGNRVTDSKYGCLVLSPQGPSRNWLNADGYPIRSAYIYGNTFENLRGDRDGVSITGVQNVHWFNNRSRGKYGALMLDAPWGIQVAGIANGAVAVYTRPVLNALKAGGVRTWDPAKPGKSRAMPVATLDSYLVLGRKPQE